MKNEQKLICTNGHIFLETELKFPHYVLDDDYPEYGGDCAICGANRGNGDIDELGGVTGLDWVKRPYAEPTTPSVEDSLAMVAVVIGLAAFYGLMIIWGN